MSSNPVWAMPRREPGSDSLPQIKRTLGVVTEATFQTYSSQDIDQVFPAAERVFKASYPKTFQSPNRNVLTSFARSATCFLLANSKGIGTNTKLHCDFRQGVFSAVFVAIMSFGAIRIIAIAILEHFKVPFDGGRLSSTLVLITAVAALLLIRLWVDRNLAKAQQVWKQILDEIDRLPADNPLNPVPTTPTHKS